MELIISGILPIQTGHQPEMLLTLRNTSNSNGTSTGDAANQLCLLSLSGPRLVNFECIWVFIENIECIWVHLFYFVLFLCFCSPFCVSIENIVFNFEFKPRILCLYNKFCFYVQNFVSFCFHFVLQLKILFFYRKFCFL